MLEVMDHCFKETVSIKGLWVFKDKGVVKCIMSYLGEVPHQLNILRPSGYQYRNLSYTFKRHKKNLYVNNTEEYSVYDKPSFNNNPIGTYFPLKVNTTAWYSGVLRQPHEYDHYDKQLIIFRHPGEAEDILKAVFNNENYEGVASADYITR